MKGVDSMKIIIIGYMHPKYDKRVFKTVELLSKNNQVIYQYWTNNTKEKIHEELNIKFLPIFYEKESKFNLLIEQKSSLKFISKSI